MTTLQRRNLLFATGCILIVGGIVSWSVGRLLDAQRDTAIKQAEQQSALTLDAVHAENEAHSVIETTAGGMQARAAAARYRDEEEAAKLELTVGQIEHEFGMKILALQILAGVMVLSGIFTLAYWIGTARSN